VIPNPEYKGEWKPKMIDNPAYKGIWSPPDIPNPAYVHDDSLYNYKDLKYVGFELWQVKSGSIFDNIIVTDSIDEAFELAKSTWEKNKDAEKEMMEKVRGWSGASGVGGAASAVLRSFLQACCLVVLYLCSRCCGVLACTSSTAAGI
jgi:hypothetical protein